MTYDDLNSDFFEHACNSSDNHSTQQSQVAGVLLGEVVSVGRQLLLLTVPIVLGYIHCLWS